MIWKSRLGAPVCMSLAVGVDARECDLRRSASNNGTCFEWETRLAALCMLPWETSSSAACSSANTVTSLMWTCNQKQTLRCCERLSKAVLLDAACDDVCGICLILTICSMWCDNWDLCGPRGTENRVSHSKCCDDAMLAAVKVRLTPRSSVDCAALHNDCNGPSTPAANHV